MNSSHLYPQKAERKTINLYKDTSIRSHRTVFNIVDEEDMYEWWEYHMEDMEHYENEKLHQFLQTAYRLLMHVSQIKDKRKEMKKWNFDIVFERTAEAGYWTFRNKRVVKYLSIYKQKIALFEYKMAKRKVTFRLPLKQENILPRQGLLGVKMHMPAKIELQKGALEILDIMSLDDVLTLKELIEELSEEMIYIEQRGPAEQSVQKLAAKVDAVSVAVSACTELKPMHEFLRAYADDIKASSSFSAGNTSSMRTLLQGLADDLQSWYSLLFAVGSAE